MIRKLLTLLITCAGLAFPQCPGGTVLAKVLPGTWTCVPATSRHPTATTVPLVDADVAMPVIHCRSSLEDTAGRWSQVCIDSAKVSWTCTNTAGCTPPVTTGDWVAAASTGTGGSSQVNVDWNAVTGLAQILHKPSLATVATSGSYTDLSNKPTIPASTAQLTESGNLYFTNARAIASLSGLYQTPISGAPATWPSFATVAVSGSYNDLSNKPTIQAQLHVINFLIDGNGSVVSTGDIHWYPITAYSCTINRIDISSDVPGAVTVDVWKAHGAIPSSANKISASAPLTLAAAQLATNGSLTGWTLAVYSGDVFGFSVQTATEVTKVMGQIWCQ